MAHYATYAYLFAICLRLSSGVPDAGSAITVASLTAAPRKRPRQSSPCWLVWLS